MTKTMIFSRIVQIVAIVILDLGAVTSYSQTQTFHYSGPIDGFAEVALTPGGRGYGDFDANFGTVTETLYYNPVAQTLEEVGSVTVTPSSGLINISGGQFGPQGSGSATLTVGNNGSFSFDTTFYSVGVPGIDPIANLLVPVSGSGTFNGQAFSGNWDIDMPLVLTSFSDTPTSLSFDEFQYPNPSPGQFGLQEGQTEITVPGTSVDLSDGSDDGTYYYKWNQDPILTTASIPDASGTFELFAAALVALGACKYFMGGRAVTGR